MKPDDKRQTCSCGHRYGDHARGGTKCLAASNDPNQRTGQFCGCYEWVGLPRWEGWSEDRADVRKTKP